MQSTPTSPLRGFDSAGNPISAEPRGSPQHTVTRREALVTGAELRGLLPPPKRKKSTPGRSRSLSLPTVPEDNVAPILPVERKESELSLSYDYDYLELSQDTRNGSRDSTSTRFSVPVSGNSDDSRFQFPPEDESSEEEFLDLADEDDIVLSPGLSLAFLDEAPAAAQEPSERSINQPPIQSINQTPKQSINQTPEQSINQTSKQSINQTIARRKKQKTMEELLKEHQENLQKVEMMYEDDIDEVNFKEVTMDYLKEKVKIADELKSLSQAAILYLQSNDDSFTEQRAEQAKAVKKKVIQFIKEAQKVLRTYQDSVPGAAQTVDPVKDATRRIKIDRVQTYVDRTVGDLNNITTEFEVLALTKPTTDAEYRSLAERFSAIAKRAEILLRESRKLCNDAVDTGLELQAKNLETAIRGLQEAHLETDTRIGEHKLGFGLVSVTDTARLVDIELPTFSGEPNGKLDYYSFKKEFEDYLKTKNYSTADQLRILQRSALKGTARESCLNMTDAESVWKYLLQTYGNVRILLSHKIEDIRRLGSCTGNSLKMREWSLMIKSKLSYVHELALSHGIEDELYFSPVLQEIQRGLPPKIHDDLKDRFKKNKPEDISRKTIFIELLNFLDSLTEDLTVEINYEMTSLNLSGKTEPSTTKPAPAQKPPFKSTPHKKTYANSANSSKPAKPTGSSEINSKDKKRVHQSSSNPPEERKCELCNGKHKFLQYCEEFQNCDVRERYKLVGRVKVCFRCLRLDSQVDFNNRERWWETHKANCNVTWECKQGRCAGRKPFKQYHFLICGYHVAQNKEIEEDYIKSLDRSLLKPDVKFLYMAPYSYHVDPTMITVNKKDDGYEILPDVDNPSIFMLQFITVEKDKKLMVFYDSGCMGASLSSRTVQMIETENVRPGPTYMSVAGAETIKLDTGDERFWLVLAGGTTKATLTGLEMPNITTPFPTWDLQEAWEELRRGYVVENPAGEPLPTVSTSIGGTAVDIMIGIRYHCYFPTLIYTLPGGLGIYKSKFDSDNGNLGILGGPHKTWRNARETANLLGPRAYFTAEARAYYVQSFVLRKTLGVVSSPEPEQTLNFSETSEDETDKCLFSHCNKHEQDSSWMVPLSWDLTGTRYILRDDSPKFSDLENLGTETSYRCVRCRNCSDCRKGEVLERVSLQEESEQALIEGCVTLNIPEKKLEAKLPFIQDPVTNLTPNQHIANKVLDSQLRLVSKNPDMLQDVIKSHNKLRSKGHVVAYSELTDNERAVMDSSPGPGYFIPWRTVYKESSLSTPCRMVFDASARTPNGGESLNNILAKGQNKLAKIMSVLMKFRTKRSAFTADVSMAYNGVKLHVEHYKYQRYLWREDLNPANPLIVMIVRTLIYGVRPSGNQTTAGFVKLSEHCKLNYPEHSRGADVLAEDAYMDDILHSEDTPEDCRSVAESLDFTLGLGSMSVKAYTFAGDPPSEQVSANGTTVGLVGMVWDPVKDTIAVDVKELYLGKPRRGKLPELVTGDIGSALKNVFTRRIATGKVNGVYDPLGLTTPVTARFKLNLHELCKLKLDWDDLVPANHLEKWIRNLEDMQSIREIKFRRSVIPAEAVSTDVEFITSVDASENIAIAVVHSRILMKNGEYYTQLVCAKSKLVSTSTIPRAELKAATMGAILMHTVKVNFGEQFKKSIFVTDSTVALYWINQDQRPLQVAVRNAVIEIRRFTLVEQWFHIETHLNIADLGTRTAEVEDLAPDGEWQNGKPWMRLERDKMPLRTVDDITMTSEDRRMASQEIKSPDIAGIVLSNLVTRVGDRYSYSKYLVDPCVMSWPKSVRVLAYVFRFLSRIAPNRTKLWSKLNYKPEPRTKNEVSGETETETVLEDYQISTSETAAAERYFFLKATSEVKHFSKERDWRNCSSEKDGILYYNSRILDGQEVNTVENTMFDLEPLSFVKPIVDRFSPVAYSIMGYTHANIVKHRNSVTTLRESRNIAFILQGRDLSNELRESCVSCRRFKAKLIEVEMGKIHENRLTIAPAFYQVQVDLLGPYTAICEHNHRSTVQVYGVVFKDPATSAIAVHVMAGYDTPSFLQAYTRFSSRYGHPSRIFIDEGSQLVKACKKMEISIIDITQTLNVKHQVGVEFQTCPVGGHNAHGMVERSVKEVKKLFNLLYSGLRLDIMTYETAFVSISNELNNLPICLGSKTSNLEHVDLITPSRLILGRNNRRALGGYAHISGPSRLMEQMDQVYKAWWQVWRDERLLDYIPQPAKWAQSNGDIKVGDLIIFLKSDKDQTFGEPVWKMGRVKELETSSDGLPRTAIVEYKNSTEAVFRTTRRSVRKIAVLHREGELELVEKLNEASRCSSVNYILNNSN